MRHVTPTIAKVEITNMQTYVSGNFYICISSYISKARPHHVFSLVASFQAKCPVSALDTRDTVCVTCAIKHVKKMTT